jgi:hypothetical protein
MGWHVSRKEQQQQQQHQQQQQQRTVHCSGAAGEAAVSTDPCLPDSSGGLMPDILHMQTSLGFEARFPFTNVRLSDL